MKESRLLGAVCACAVSLVLSTNVNAAIFDSDTYLTDTATGLEWLDMSYTDSLSFNAVLAATSGGSLDSWSIASESQVLGLVTNYLGHSPSVGWSGNNVGVLGLVDILGPTVVPAIDQRYIYGFTSEGSNQYTVFGDYFFTDGSSLYRTGQAASSQDSAYGTFLVREIPATVPIPAAVWLFGSGLLGLVGIARRKKTT